MMDSCIIRFGVCLIIAICFIVCMVTPKLRRYVRWYSGFTGGGHISRLSCAVLALDALLWGVKFWSDCIHYPLFSNRMILMLLLGTVTLIVVMSLYDYVIDRDV
jgi:hypothetical protein